MGKLRLDKYLAEMGLGTRSEVKKLLRQGQVLVNGQKMKSPEYKIEPGEDKVEAQGKEVSYVRYEYFMLHKPQGVITATEDRGQKTVMEFIRFWTRTQKGFCLLQMTVNWLTGFCPPSGMWTKLILSG